MQSVTPSYSQGIQVRANKFLSRPGELIMAMNVVAKFLGSWSCRNGYTQTGSTLQSGKDILGMHSLEQNDGTNKHFAVVNNSGGTQSVLKYYVP